MKNKAPLALIELTVMILIFSLAAALCLQAFAWSDLKSSEISERDKAMLQAETAAEVLKACRGDFSEAAELLYGTCDGEDTLTVYFDEEWLASDEETAHARLDAVKKEDNENLLGTAEISVWNGKEENIFCMDVCWQEVTEDGK